MLTLPLCGYIKTNIPSAEVSFLGRTYTEPIINCVSTISNFLNWDLLEKKPQLAIDTLKKFQFDIVIHAFPDKNVVRMAWAANIPKRIGVNRRFHNLLFCNVRPSFSRKNSNLHEAQLNLKLAESLFTSFKVPNLQELSALYFFEPKATLPNQFHFLAEPGSQKIILHPKSKGSAVEWGLKNFESLAYKLAENNQVFITGTKAEGEMFGNRFKQKHKNLHILTGALSLPEFITFINQCDALVAASTGPLHIAAALGKKAVGLYSPLNPIHPGRWAPIGKNAHAITSITQCSTCKKPVDCSCVSNINPQVLLNILS